VVTHPWLEHYDGGVPATLHPYPERTLLDYLRDAAAQRPDAPAILFKGATVSHARLERESDAFAAALVGLGIGKGDRVALLLPNCPQFLVAELGAWKVGAIVAPLNPLYSDREIGEALTRSQPAAMVVLNRFYDRVKAIQPATTVRHVVTANIKEYLPPALRFLFTVLKEKKEGDRIRIRDGDHRMADLLRTHAGAEPRTGDVAPDDPAVLLMSGGTTGSAKAVLGLHRSLVTSGTQIRSWLSPILGEWDDRVLIPLPLFHVYANAGGQSLALMGHNPMVLVPNPRDLNDVVATIGRTRPALFLGVPALFSAMLEHPKVRSGKVDVRSIKGCFSGASALLAETKRRFEETTGGLIVEGYSLTEAMMACCANPVRGTNKIGSVGLPLPDVQVRIVNPDDPALELPAGTPGEVLLRAPQVMAGYWHDPAETALALHDAGDGTPWLCTGDLGYLDDDGYLFIVDRKKDLIKVSGLQVWPREIEEIIATHPAVGDVGVAAIPHERKGEVPKAWIVLRPGATATATEIRAACRESLAPYKVPAEVEFCSELPRNLMGKVLRRELRAQAATQAVAVESTSA
jgi:long-chain acyl-CoA synthetase